MYICAICTYVYMLSNGFLSIGNVDFTSSFRCCKRSSLPGICNDHISSDPICLFLSNKLFTFNFLLIFYAATLKGSYVISQLSYIVSELTLAIYNSVNMHCINAAARAHLKQCHNLNRAHKQMDHE